MFFAKKRRDKARKRKVIILDTNIPIDCTKYRKLEFLDRLEAEAEVFVPWAVCRELISTARMAEEDKEVVKGEDFEKYMEWRDSLEEKLTPQQVKARQARIEYAEDACSFVQQKINSGKWKTIGTHSQLKKYIDGFSETLKEQVQMRRADLEVLACCFIAAEEYKKAEIILMTLDRRLRNIAEKFSIRTHEGSRDPSLFKK